MARLALFVVILALGTPAVLGGRDCASILTEVECGAGCTWCDKGFCSISPECHRPTKPTSFTATVNVTAELPGGRTGVAIEVVYRSQSGTSVSSLTSLTSASKGFPTPKFEHNLVVNDPLCTEAGWTIGKGVPPKVKCDMSCKRGLICNLVTDFEYGKVEPAALCTCTPPDYFETLPTSAEATGCTQSGSRGFKGTGKGYTVLFCFNGNTPLSATFTKTADAAPAPSLRGVTDLVKRAAAASGIGSDIDPTEFTKATLTFLHYTGTAPPASTFTPPPVCVCP